MIKLTLKDIPVNVSVCGETGCPQASSCLHQQAYALVMDTREKVTIVNPKLCRNEDGTCKFYASDEPVAYAIGFTQMQQKMLVPQYAEFSELLKTHFGRNPYFDRRNGKLPLSPHDQKIIRKALVSVGLPEDLPFDKYEMRLVWNNRDKE